MNRILHDLNRVESLEQDLWNGQESQIRPRRDGNRSETRISQLRELRVNCSARFRVRFSTPFKQDRPAFIVRPLILFPHSSRPLPIEITWLQIFSESCGKRREVLTIHVFPSLSNSVSCSCLFWYATTSSHALCLFIHYTAFRIEIFEYFEFRLFLLFSECLKTIVIVHC